MMGRFANNDPWSFGKLDSAIFGASGTGLSREEVLIAYGKHIQDYLDSDPKGGDYVLIKFVKPIINLFNHEVGCK